MKEKYEFLLSLKSLEFEINELTAYSKDHPDCFELLKEKLDLLSHFMTCEKNAEQWSRWEGHEEIRQNGDLLRETSVQALCDMEKYQSMSTYNQQLNVSDYLEVLSGTVKEELRQFNIDHTSKVLFIGSGAFPLSALTIAKETGAEVMCIDIDAEALQLGRQVAELSGLEAQVQFSGGKVKELDFLQEATHVLIASLVKNKLEVVADLKDGINENVKIVLRYGNGLKSVFNYPWEQDLSADWVQTNITRNGSLYDTLVLEPKKAEVAPEPFGNTLLIGAGPAGIHVAVDVARGWCAQLGLLNRPGTRTDRIKQELEQTEGRVSTEARVEKYQHLAGEAELSRFYEGFEEIEDNWETLFFCTPSDAYGEIVDALQLTSLRKVKRIVLLSPGIGSALLVQNRLGELKEQIEVISLSTYYAATKFESGSLLKSSIKGMKKKVYVGSSQGHSEFVQEVRRFLESLGVACEMTGHPLEAESKSITTYVHPPFFLQEFSLAEIFSTSPSKKSMYKLYPEGPITPDAIRTMLLLWKEVSALLRTFDAEPVNLLKFLNDDNYPVHEMTLSRNDIENFMSLDPVKQEYLLYVRYSAILIDPFSKPDEQGRYFDFSAVPYKQVYQGKDGRWVIPRIPFEDYKKLKLLYSLGQQAQLPMPQTEQLIQVFEVKLQEFIQAVGRENVNEDVLADTAVEDADAIVKELEACR